jgi:hypothetical protein
MAKPAPLPRLPVNFSVTPAEYQAMTEAAYVSLPPRLRAVLARRVKNVTVFIQDGDMLGAAMASDFNYEILDNPQALVRWPAGQATVDFPWGKVTLLQAIRHELAHLGLEILFSANSALWVDIPKALREEGPEFLEAVTRGHRGAAELFSRSTIAHYSSLHEYLASLIEFCGTPVRMPLPKGRALPMVRALVSGGVCR